MMRMVQWEYDFAQVPTGVSIAAVCERAGLEGWEAWHVSSMPIEGRMEHTIYFKRPIAMLNAISA